MRFAVILKPQHAEDGAVLFRAIGLDGESPGVGRGSWNEFEKVVDDCTFN